MKSPSNSSHSSSENSVEEAACIFIQPITTSRGVVLPSGEGALLYQSLINKISLQAWPKANPIEQFFNWPSLFPKWLLTKTITILYKDQLCTFNLYYSFAQRRFLFPQWSQISIICDPLIPIIATNGRADKVEISEDRDIKNLWH